MVDINLRNPDFVSDAAVHICKEHGIIKAVDFLSHATNGLNPVQLFAVCEDKAKLKENTKGEIYVEWTEREVDEVCGVDGESSREVK